LGQPVPGPGDAGMDAAGMKAEASSQRR
jgi:hypothetical protein